MRALFLAGALALGLAGAAGAQTSAMGSGLSNAAPGDAAAALPTADYVTKAGQSDQFEIQEGQLASTLAKSPSVKNFGMMMVTAHRRTTEVLQQTLQHEGQTPPPPPALSADQQAQIDQLRSLNGRAFDRAYIDQQIAAHQEALKVQADYAKGGSDPQLRQAAGHTVPIVQNHLRTLMTLQAKANGAS